MKAAWLGLVRWCTTRDRLFWATTIATCLFFLVQDGFFTLDGWAHGANAQLMTAVAAGDAHFTGYVEFNPSPVPNWGGHVLLALLQRMFPAVFAEKVLWALLVLLIASGCLRFVKAATGRCDALIVLCLPVILGQVFVLGFYNFQLSVGVAFWGAAFWAGRGRTSWWHWPVLALFSLLVFFCHGTGVVFALALVMAAEVCRSQRPAARWPWWSMAGVALVFIPVLLLLFFFDNGQPGTPQRLPATELLDRLWRFTWLAPYDATRERVQLILFLAALFLGLAMVVRSSLRPGDSGRRTAWPLLALSLALFIAYFILPDDTGYASYISLRLITLAMLLLVSWMAASGTAHPGTSFVAVSLAVLCVAGKLVFMAGEGAQARADRDVVLRAAEHLGPGDVVLPVWRDHRWLFAHRADLLGLNRPVLLLENSECNKGYFPLVWGAKLPQAFDRVAHYADGCHAGLRAHMRSGAMPLVDHIALLGPDIDTTECSVKEIIALADSLDYHTTFRERDVLLLSRPSSP